MRDPTVLHQAMHRYLAGCGVDGVKVDAQSGLTCLSSNLVGGYTQLASKYNVSLEESVAKFFPDNVLINCMCHSIDNLMHFRESALARASDDFYPRDEAAGAPHVTACAFNSLFLSGIVQPDWDMFQVRRGRLVEKKEEGGGGGGGSGVRRERRRRRREGSRYNNVRSRIDKG